MNLILIGFMGSGKTTIGRALAKELGIDFLDLDVFIEENEGKSIKNIFSKQGEQAFRNLETKALEMCFQSSYNRILSTGGGVVIKKENRELLNKNGFVIYLRTRSETILTRIGKNCDRPLLQVENREERIRDLMEERESFYLKTAHYVIDTDELSKEEVLAALKHEVIERRLFE